MFWSASSVWRRKRVASPGIKCLNNDEASLTWLVIQNALWVGKKFSAHLAISPECGRCGALEESINHAFFHCPVVQSLCKLLEGFMVRIPNGKFFVLEASSVCSNVVAKLNRLEHNVFLCLLGIMRVVIWTRKKEFFEDVFFFSDPGVLFLNTKLKSKSGLRERDSLRWSLAKGGWLLRACVAW